MKKILVNIIVLVFALMLVGCIQESSLVNETPNVAQKGRVIFTIADTAADMGHISSINVTIDSVSIQSTTKGWITVSYAQKTFDLLQLKASGIHALLADINLNEGNYNQIRLHISKVSVTDAMGTHEAKLPSNDLKIAGTFNVNENSTSAVTFDFIADESLHTTGNGQYILAPVVHFQTMENVEVTVDGKDIRVKNGNVKTNIKIGMDENGIVGSENKIHADTNLSISGNGKINNNGKNQVSEKKLSNENIGKNGSKQDCDGESCYYEATGKSMAENCLKTSQMAWCDNNDHCINPAAEICK